MNIIDMGIQLKSLGAPKSRQDVIMLLQLACDEMDILNAHIKEMHERAENAALAS
jgi:hypothetical protein